jgi:hypothetical protein
VLSIPFLREQVDELVGVVTALLYAGRPQVLLDPCPSHCIAGNDADKFASKIVEHHTHAQPQLALGAMATNIARTTGD